MILLTDYEALEASYKNPNKADMLGVPCPLTYKRVAKAQLKKVVEYIDKNFYIGVDGNGDIEYEGDYERWQALLREIE